MRTAEDFDLRYCATPASVPPVPVAAQKASILPWVSRQISGPVDSKCALRLAVLSN